MTYPAVPTTFVPGTLVTADWLNWINQRATEYDSAVLTPSADKTFGPLDYATDTTGSVDQSTLLSTCTSSLITGSIDSYFPYTQMLKIPAGNYKIDSNWTMPQRVVSYGKFTGSGLLTTTKNFGRYTDLVCNSGITASGLFNTTFDGFYGPLTVDGGGLGKGTFWSRFNGGINGNLTINTGNFSVNFNQFGNYHGGSINIADGGGSSYVDCHANMFWMCDVSGASGGLTNNSTHIDQTNWAIGTYYEGGATISGNFHVLAYHGDDGGPPQIPMDNWAILSTNIMERNRGDFMPYGGQNLLVGGDWDVLTLDAASGLYWPACYSGYGARTPSLVTDTTEPSGVGRGLQFTFSAAGAGNAGFVVNVPPTPNARAVLVIFWKGSDAPGYAFLQRPDMTTTYYGMRGVKVRSGSDWYISRFSLNTSSSGTSQFIVDFGTSGGTIVLGGAFASGTKAVRLPQSRTDLKVLEPTSNGYCIQVQDKYQQGGVVTKAATAAVANIVEVPITFNTAFSAAPAGIVGDCQYSVELTDTTNGPKMSKSWIKSGSVTTTGFTVQIYTAGATDTWQGRINWRATGPR